MYDYRWVSLILSSGGVRPPWDGSYFKLRRCTTTHLRSISSHSPPMVVHRLKSTPSKVVHRPKSTPSIVVHRLKSYTAPRNSLFLKSYTARTIIHFWLYVRKKDEFPLFLSDPACSENRVVPQKVLHNPHHHHWNKWYGWKWGWIIYTRFSAQAVSL